MAETFETPPETPGEAAAPGSASAPRSVDEIVGLLSSADWNDTATVFDAAGKVLFTTMKSAPQTAELQALFTAYDDYDKTIGNGVSFCGTHFDVHRLYPSEGLAYGRARLPQNNDGGAGFCLYRPKSKSSQSVVIMITYNFPVVSARAIDSLRKFTATFIEPYLASLG